MILYENVYKAKNSLYARTYDTETKESSTEAVKFIPDLYMHSQDNSLGLVSVPENQSVRMVKLDNMKEYKDTIKMMDSTGTSVYGNSSQEFGYIRQNWANPIESDHDFHTWFYDIEVAVLDKSVDKVTSKDDWKPTGHERAAMGTITSIQIYDTKDKEFYILGLKKDWENENNFTSKHGKINYWNMSSEENLLKAFLTILNEKKPLVLSGWNTQGYDEPYITNRIIRLLDKRDDLYVWEPEEKRLKFNKSCLNGGYVKQLSPVGLITHRETETNFGMQDEFKWAGIILEDYKELYHKYTYTSLTSYSLDSVAEHELGANKVNHDEFTDFTDFYENSFNLFVEYGIQDVILLIEINEKLKLIDLAKFIAYICGVTMNDIRGTVKQWNNYMFNNHLDKGMVLPLKGKFGVTDNTILVHGSNMEDLNPAKREKYQRLLNDKEKNGQTFPGGITRGTGKFWREVFSLDFGSLYPSCIQWANIGIETLIHPRDLPKELLDLRARYAIYYEKGIEPKELLQFDLEFAEDVLGNKEAQAELESVLKKHNCSMTPNGMFFKLNKRSILSQRMEDIIVQRKVHKKNMKTELQKMENLKAERARTSDEARLKQIDIEFSEASDLADKYNVYQMGLKIFLNSCYGSLSMQSTVFAGDKEFFSSAVTSSARVSNLIAGQVNSQKIDSIMGFEAQEERFGRKTYLDHIPQQDTDSCDGKSIIEVNGVKTTIEDYFNSKQEDSLETRNKNNLIKHIKKQSDFTSSLNIKTGEIEHKKINYIMAHKVKKRMFRIKHKNTYVDVTEDHSVVVKRNGFYVDVKPTEIFKGCTIILLEFKTEDFIVQDLGIQEQWVYDLEVQDNHNFFANEICIHNSNYCSIDPIVVKKFGEDYRETTERRRITEFTENYINKISLPCTYEKLASFSKALNAPLPEKLVEDPEVICDNFISLVPKMYFARKFWDEGIYLNEPKLKVTGLSMVRTTTPKFYREELKKAMEIIIDGDIPKVIDYIESVKEATAKQNPKDIAINQGVSSLDYTWEPNIKKFRKFNGKKYLGAPVNSRACLTHNLYVKDKTLPIKDIEPGDKISFLYMKVPNPLFNSSNALGFKDVTIFNKENGDLMDYIDRDVMFEKGFEKSIKLITDPLKWDLTPPENLIDDDEW